MPAQPPVSAPMQPPVAFALKAPASTDALMMSKEESLNSSLQPLSAVTLAVPLLTAPMQALADSALMAHASIDAEILEILNQLKTYLD